MTRCRGRPGQRWVAGYCPQMPSPLPNCGPSFDPIECSGSSDVAPYAPPPGSTTWRLGRSRATSPVTSGEHVEHVGHAGESRVSKGGLGFPVGVVCGARKGCHVPDHPSAARPACNRQFPSPP